MRESQRGGIPLMVQFPCPHPVLRGCKTECPRQTLRPDGGKTGDGSAPRSLSRTGIRRALTGLPASRRCSPRQAESPASQQGRPAPCGHWISRPLSAGTAAALDGAFAPCHGSRLFTLRLRLAHRPAVPFVASPTLRKVFTGLAQTSCPSRSGRLFCPPFGGFDCRLSCDDRQSCPPRADSR
jgi:hypothetical protein